MEYCTHSITLTLAKCRLYNSLIRLCTYCLPELALEQSF